MDPSLDPLAQIAGLGVGALIAFVVLRWKRDDDKQHDSQLSTLIEEGNRRFDTLLDTVRATTEAINSLRSTLGERDAIEQSLQRVEKSIDKLRNGE